MKRTTSYIALALVTALAVCALAGCASSGSSSSASKSASGSASAASASASAASASASAASAQSQNELIAELKDAISKVPAYKSVTIDAESEFALKGNSESLKEASLYKFDASGDKLKTSVDIDSSGIKLKYITDGNDAVCITDGPIYSGTVEQFELAYAAGADTYIKETIGDLGVLVDCASTVEKMESHGITAYILKLDPEKYIASDEIYTSMASAGSPVKAATVTVGFNENGSIGSLDLKTEFDDTSSLKGLSLRDYDSTVIDPMPEATKTFEDFVADEQAKLEALFGEDENQAGDATTAK